MAKGKDKNSTNGGTIPKSQKEVMAGHKADDRFAESSMNMKDGIVRPSKTAKVTKAKHEPQRKWNLGSNHNV